MIPLMYVEVESRHAFTCVRGDVLSAGGRRRSLTMAYIFRPTFQDPFSASPSESETGGGGQKQEERGRRADNRRGDFL